MVLLSLEEVDSPDSSPLGKLPSVSLVRYASFSWRTVSRRLVLVRIYLRVAYFRGDFVVYKLVYFEVDPHVAFAKDVPHFCHSRRLRTAPRF